MEVPFLGRIPIYQPIREGGDTGRPIVTAEPDSPAGRALFAVAEQAAAQISIASYNAADHPADRRPLTPLPRGVARRSTGTAKPPGQRARSCLACAIRGYLSTTDRFPVAFDATSALAGPGDRASDGCGPAPGALMNIPYTRHALDNGLSLIVHEDHNCPIVAVNVW